MLHIHNVHFYFQHRHILKNIQLTLQPNEVLGLLGLNGAGKTTLMRLMVGLLTPSSGRIEMNGYTPEDGIPWRQQVAFLPDRPPLYTELTVNEMLEHTGILYGLSSSTRRQRRDEVLQRVSITNVATQRIESLSHGYKQRVGIAAMLMHRPALLVLDEPTTGLDPMQIVEMRKLLKDLSQEHTIVVSSHILAEVQQTCSRIALIHQGTLAAVHDAGSATQNQWQATVSGTQENVQKFLQSWKQCSPVSSTKQDDESVIQWYATTPQEVEKIAAGIVSHGLGLRLLKPPRSPLETTFLRLTQGEEVLSADSQTTFSSSTQKVNV